MIYQSKAHIQVMIQQEVINPHRWIQLPYRKQDDQSMPDNTYATTSIILEIFILFSYYSN